MTGHQGLRQRTGYVITIAQYTGHRPRVHVACTTCTWDAWLTPDDTNLVEDTVEWSAEAVSRSVAAWGEHEDPNVSRACPAALQRRLVGAGMTPGDADKAIAIAMDESAGTPAGGDPHGTFGTKRGPVIEQARDVSDALPTPAEEVRSDG